MYQQKRISEKRRFQLNRGAICLSLFAILSLSMLGCGSDDDAKKPDKLGGNETFDNKCEEEVSIMGYPDLLESVQGSITISGGDKSEASKYEMTMMKDFLSAFVILSSEIDSGGNIEQTSTFSFPMVLEGEPLDEHSSCPKVHWARLRLDKEKKPKTFIVGHNVLLTGYGCGDFGELANLSTTEIPECDDSKIEFEILDDKKTYKVKFNQFPIIFSRKDADPGKTEINGELTMVLKDVLKYQYVDELPLSDLSKNFADISTDKGESLKCSQPGDCNEGAALVYSFMERAYRVGVFKNLVRNDDESAIKSITYAVSPVVGKSEPEIKLSLNKELSNKTGDKTERHPLICEEENVFFPKCESSMIVANDTLSEVQFKGVTVKRSVGHGENRLEHERKITGSFKLSDN